MAVWLWYHNKGKNVESKDNFPLTEKLCVDIIIRRAPERKFLVCKKADLQQPQSISQEVKRMPTFNPVSYTHLDVYKRQMH